MSKKTTGSIKDDLANSLADGLNKKFKESGLKVAYFLDGTGDSPNEITDWVPTGCSMLDLAIANKANGGWPVGRITEISGLEASGKSLLAAHALANTQKKGGLAVYIDTESAVSSEFLKAIGVDITKMLYVPLETIEDVFEAIEAIIESARKSNKDRLVTIVVDSIMGASTKIEMSADYDKDGYATSKSIILSKAMRKVTSLISKQKICLILTNQLRTKMNAMFGDPYTTSGGKAVAFHSSCRVRIKQMGQIKVKKDGVDMVAGIKTRVQVTKNRMGPPLKSVDYNIYFDSGIDDTDSWLTVMEGFGIIKQSGAWYSFGDLKFQAKEFDNIRNTKPEIIDEMYKQICDKYILKYNPHDDENAEVTIAPMNEEDDEANEENSGKPKKEKKDKKSFEIPE